MDISSQKEDLWEGPKALTLRVHCSDLTDGRRHYSCLVSPFVSASSHCESKSKNARSASKSSVRNRAVSRNGPDGAASATRCFESCAFWSGWAAGADWTH